jgi:hypothetical protein
VLATGSGSRLSLASSARLAAAAGPSALLKAASLRPRAPPTPRAPAVAAVAAAGVLPEEDSADPGRSAKPTMNGSGADAAVAVAAAAKPRALAAVAPREHAVPLFAEATLSLTPSELVKPDVIAAIAHRRAASSRDLGAAGAALARADSGFDAAALRAAGTAGASRRGGAVRDDKGRLAFPVALASGDGAGARKDGGDGGGGGGGDEGHAAAAEEAAAGLPAGWKPVWSKTQAKFYWACKETGEKVWVKPTEPPV